MSVEFQGKQPKFALKLTTKNIKSCDTLSLRNFPLFFLHWPYLMLGFCFCLMVSHTKDRPERIIKMWLNKMTSNLSSSTITTVTHIKSNIACYNFPEAPKIPNTIAAMMINTTNVSIRHIFWFCHHILRCSRLDCVWKTWDCLQKREQKKTTFW